MSLFTSQHIHLLEKALTASSVRQKAISHNIANVDTPNYKSKRVQFKNELQKAKLIQAKKTDVRHLNFNSTSDMDYLVHTNHETTMRNNGNNVDIEKEMALLAENQIYYNALVERLNGQFSTIKAVARGGQ